MENINEFLKMVNLEIVSYKVTKRLKELEVEYAQKAVDAVKSKEWEKGIDVIGPVSAALGKSEMEYDNYITENHYVTELMYYYDYYNTYNTEKEMLKEKKPANDREKERIAFDIEQLEFRINFALESMKRLSKRGVLEIEQKPIEKENTPEEEKTVERENEPEKQEPIVKENKPEEQEPVVKENKPEEQKPTEKENSPEVKSELRQARIHTVSNDKFNYRVVNGPVPQENIVLKTNENGVADIPNLSDNLRANNISNNQTQEPNKMQDVLYQMDYIKNHLTPEKRKKVSFITRIKEGLKNRIEKIKAKFSNSSNTETINEEKRISEAEINSLAGELNEGITANPVVEPTYESIQNQTMGYSR